MNRPFEDEWGQDPSVQSMRRVFSYMEEAQQQLFRDLNISLYDQRLRRGRQQALGLFEQAWPLAIKKGIITSEKDAAPFYLHCLGQALKQARIEVPDELLPKDEKIIRFLQKERS
jgi:hypothetical protein